MSQPATEPVVRPDIDTAAEIIRPHDLYSRPVGGKSDLKGVRNLSSVFCKFDHDLLVQPDIHGSRIVCVAGIVQFFCKLLARRETAVEFEKLQ